MVFNSHLIKFLPQFLVVLFRFNKRSPCVLDLCKQLLLQLLHLRNVFFLWRSAAHLSEVVLELIIGQRRVQHPSQSFAFLLVHLNLTMQFLELSHGQRLLKSLLILSQLLYLPLVVDYLALVTVDDAGLVDEVVRHTA